MLEGPTLVDNLIVARVQEQFGISVRRLEFLPVGQDSAAWAYRVHSDGETSYFLKVRRGSVRTCGLVLPHLLNENGMAQVIVAELTKSQAPWAELDGYSLTLAPFVESGPTGVSASGNFWEELGGVIKRLHATSLPPKIAPYVKLETFKPDWIDWAGDLLQQVQERTYYDDVYQRQLAVLMRQRESEIRQLIDRAAELGRWLRQSPPPFVLCHSDLHIYNFMLDNQGRLFIVDWDEATLAPKERDLMFVIGGISENMMNARGQRLFFQGYGRTDIDPVALAYYRYAWAVQDIGAFAERVFFPKDTGEATRQEAVAFFNGLFRLGAIVDLAFQAEDLL